MKEKYTKRYENRQFDSQNLILCVNPKRQSFRGHDLNFEKFGYMRQSDQNKKDTKCALIKLHIYVHVCFDWKLSRSSSKTTAFFPNLF